MKSWQLPIAGAGVFAPNFSPDFVVLPLTYDEEDYADAMTWVRQGAAPHVTPLGFEGDGWSARLRSTTVPVWLSGASSELGLLASVRIRHARPMQSAGDTVVHLGAGASGTTPQAKMALRVLQDPNNVQWPFLALSCYTGSTVTMPLARAHWCYEGRFPHLISNGKKVRPQAILFRDDGTVLVAGHYEDAETKVLQIDLTTRAVVGAFTFGTVTHRHVAAFAENSAGEVWCVDYDTGHTLRIDVEASLASGAAVVTADWNTAALSKVSGLTFAEVGGTEHVLIGEYATSGTPYLYVIPASLMADGATFTAASRYKRFSMGRRTQGITIHNGELWAAKNIDAATSTTAGWVERYGDAAALISGTTDGAIISPVARMAGPSQYTEDIKFHPVTGHMWMMTEGWGSVADWDGWLGIWSSPVDGTEVENHVEAHYTGGGIVRVRVNGFLFAEAPWTPTAAVAAVSIGAPPDSPQGFTAGYFKGFVRNVRIQDQRITSAQYEETIRGDFEPNALTEHVIALVNPGAESGTTGWANEVGGIATRGANPTAYEGANYFSGGSNAQTIARQRRDLLADTSLTADDIDVGEVWAKTRWWQASYTNQDPCSMGLRSVSGAGAELGLTYGNIAWVLYGNSGVTPNWQPLAVAAELPTGTRSLDAVYRSDRTDGTNNDGYVDAITLAVYAR